MDPSKIKDWQEFSPDIQVTYKQQAFEVLKQLLSDKKYKCNEGHFLRRGPGSSSNFYAEGIHQDYCETPEEFAENIEAFAPFGKPWLNNFNANLQGFGVICFWRPIHLKAPLLHKPLAVLDC